MFASRPFERKQVQSQIFGWVGAHMSGSVGFGCVGGSMGGWGFLVGGAGFWWVVQGGR